MCRPAHPQKREGYSVQSAHPQKREGYSVQSAHPQKREGYSVQTRTPTEKRRVQCADPHSPLPASCASCPPQRELHTQPRSQCHRVVQTHNYASASLEFAPKLPGPRSRRQNLYAFADLCLVLSYFVLLSPDGKPTVGSSAT